MRSRFVTVRDSLTKMRCLVLELEEVDRAVCDDRESYRVCGSFFGSKVGKLRASPVTNYETQKEEQSRNSLKRWGQTGRSLRSRRCCTILKISVIFQARLTSRRGASNMPHLSLAISSVRRSKKQYLSCLVSL
jgi:hypothetical protein